MRSSTTFFAMILPMLAATVLEAQSLGQDAEGFSTIFVPSATLNLDISNDIANFSYYGLVNRKLRPAKPSETTTILGVELKGKEQNGIANIFSDGNVAVGASANLLVGIRWFSEKTRSANSSWYQPQLDTLKLLQAKISAKQQEGLDTIKKYLDQEYIDDDLGKLARKVIRSIDSDSIRKHIVPIQELENRLREKKEQKRKIHPDKVKMIIQFFDKDHLDRLDLRRKIQKELDDDDERRWTPYFQKVFLRGGGEGASFMQDLGNNASIVKERFEKTEFYGGHIELGYNLQIKDRTFLGFSISTAYTNNLAQLGGTDYTLIQVDTTIKEGQFTTSTSLKAFTNYETFNRYSINFDYIRVFHTKTVDGSPSNLFLTLNPYVRHRIYANGKKLKNNMILGVALNAFSSKKQRIMGGVFVQNNDVFGVHADDDETFGKRTTFGLIAKFSFGGFDLKEKEK